MSLGNSQRAAQLTYDIPVKRLPNSKNLPENMKAARCNSGRALPKGVSRKPPSFRLNPPQDVPSSAARKWAREEGDEISDGSSKNSTVASRRCGQ
jgi:hypothetical protein